MVDLIKALPELFGYIGIVKEFKHVISPDKTQSIVFDSENKKQIKIPEIIIDQMRFRKNIKAI